ncbi:ead/Ea22-like family protein [Escherichia coli]|nr:ead/Ea22-like family protein [Escherichia coli]
MTALNKQALREAAERAESDSWGYDRDEFNEALTPSTVLALLDELEAAEKRIAELEARTVKLPEYRNSPDMHTKQFYEAIGFNQGLDVFIEALRAAGIGVKGE